MRRILNHRNGGFTLVEIMIVVAIIALLAAIAIPNLLRARHNANEGAAIGAMHTLVSACESFRAAQTPPVYPANLAALSAANPPYVDATLTAAAGRQGYNYTYALVNANQYTLNAAPLQAGVSGTRGFFADETGVIRHCNATAAGQTADRTGAGQDNTIDVAPAACD